jgi:hypothetical protein
MDQCYSPYGGVAGIIGWHKSLRLAPHKSVRAQYIGGFFRRRRLTLIGSANQGIAGGGDTLSTSDYITN